MKKFPRLLQNASGFSLLEVIVAGGILSVVLLVSTQLTSFVSERMRSQRQAATLDRMTINVKNLAGMASALRNSMDSPLNAEFRDCVIADATYPPAEKGTCRGDDQWQPFALYGAIFGTAAAGGTVQTGMVAGPTNAAVYYDISGAPCANSATTDECPLQVTTEFRAQCPNEYPSLTPSKFCDVAEEIEIAYVIRLRTVTTAGKGKSKKGKGKGKAGSSTMVVDEDLGNFREVRGFESVPVREISGYSPSVNKLLMTLPPPIDPNAPIVPEPPVDPKAKPSTPLNCPGDTVKVGTYQCACRSGFKLVNPKKGKCSPIGA